MKTSWIAGVDGCRRGWFAVLASHEEGRVIETRHDVCRSFKDVLDLNPAPGFIAIDIPIGLLDERRAGGVYAIKRRGEGSGSPAPAAFFLRLQERFCLPGSFPRPEDMGSPSRPSVSFRKFVK